MPDQPSEQHILNKTLGDILQNNDHAQGMIMKAMQIGPEQFQQLLNATGNNQFMNMTIGDLFKNGVVKQATQLNKNTIQPTQLSPEQAQQIMGILQNGQLPLSQNNINEGGIAYSVPHPMPKQGIWEKVKKFFG